MPTAALTLAIFLGWVVGGSEASVATSISTNGQGPQEEAIGVVHDYIRGGNLDLTPDERAYMLQSGSIEEVRDWPFLEQLKAHRLFAVQMGWNRQAYVLVVVSSGSKAWHISNEADFNELLRDEGVLIGSEDEARDVAQLFLKCQRISAVLYQKWELGMNLVVNLDDIEFRSETERREVAKIASVEPPQLTRNAEQFEYVLYSWDKYGAGALRRHRVVISAREIVDYEVVLLKPNAGKWKPL